jgi:hypothetical protein
MMSNTPRTPKTTTPVEAKPATIPFSVVEPLRSANEYALSCAKRKLDREFRDAEQLRAWGDVVIRVTFCDGIVDGNLTVERRLKERMGPRA